MSTLQDPNMFWHTKNTKNAMFVTLAKELALVSQGSGSLSLRTYCSTLLLELQLVPLHIFL